MEPATSQNPNKANLDDLQLRAKSQYIYVLVGAVAVAVIGIVLVAVLWDTLALQNTLLIGAATIFGIVILVISAADMKANDRGFGRHRDEQEIMEKLSDKYRKKSAEAAANSGIESATDEPKTTRTRR